jgi:lipid II:glycine glycyltransferase (peptidoglycan interpeptide bridge formation enzyme)
MPVLSASEWDSFLTRYPEAHVLQSSVWGELKSAFDWTPVRIESAQSAQAAESSESGAQVLFRRLPLGFSVAYLPKGPLGEYAAWDSLWPELDRVCRQHRAVFLLVEPDASEPPNKELLVAMQKFGKAAQPIQPRRTVLVDLSGSEEQVLERMKQKTRYNIHLAQRKGVVVNPVDDLLGFNALMKITGERDGFEVHSPQYYRRAFDLFSPQGRCALLVAEYEGRPLAGLMVFYQGRRAWYFYGASSDEERNRMPAYLLQWEAMRWARQHGCSEYDLWGVPDVDEAVLESHFTDRSDGLWGVYRFKRGFGGRVDRSAGAWQRVYNPLLYRLYQWRMKNRNPGG